MHRLVKRKGGMMKSAGAALCAVVITGCTQLGPAERDSLQMAAQLYTKGDLRGATTRLDKLIADHPRTAEVAEAYYVRGLCKAKSGQIPGAKADFDQAVNRSNRADLTARARASIGALVYQSGDWARAAQLYDEALSELPNQPPKDSILFAAGVAAQRAGRWSDASRRFAEVLNNFRDRPVAALARQKSQWRYPYFAVQLGAFRTMTSAQSAAANWRRRGLEANEEGVPRNGQIMWLVISGRYPTYHDAQQGLLQAKKHVPDAVIVP